jgi:hypothetical protein
VRSTSRRLKGFWRAVLHRAIVALVCVTIGMDSASACRWLRRRCRPRCCQQPCPQQICPPEDSCAVIAIPARPGDGMATRKDREDAGRSLPPKDAPASAPPIALAPAAPTNAASEPVPTRLSPRQGDETSRRPDEPSVPVEPEPNPAMVETMQVAPRPADADAPPEKPEPSKLRRMAAAGPLLPSLPSLDVEAVRRMYRQILDVMIAPVAAEEIGPASDAAKAAVPMRPLAPLPPDGPALPARLPDNLFDEPSGSPAAAPRQDHPRRRPARTTGENFFDAADGEQPVPDQNEKAGDPQAATPASLPPSESTPAAEGGPEAVESGGSRPPQPGSAAVESAAPVSALLSVSASPRRLWVDITGQWSTTGRLVDVGPGQVRILKFNGRLTTVSLRQLSDHDRRYAQGVYERIVQARRRAATVALREDVTESRGVSLAGKGGSGEFGGAGATN